VEYEAAGVDWGSRGQRLTDTVAACRALWTAAPASFSSPTVSFADVWCEPRPLARIPVWFAGGLHERNLDRITRLGDGWIPPPYGSPADLVAPVRRLRDAWEAAGRDPEDLQVQGDPLPVLDGRGRPDIEATMETAHAWLDAGATTVNLVVLMFAHRLERALDVVPRLADAWRTVLASR
jgi:alkanesulfonate monooxygenase SsuD/methylene tetrahydromethanopterin reductase-like flavin-dependent oxidoreductase (luciferase family)